MNRLTVAECCERNLIDDVDLEDEELDAAGAIALARSVIDSPGDLSHYDHGERLRGAGSWEIDAIDGDPEELSDDGALWVVSERTLLLDGSEVACWTRCSAGRWGGNGGPGTRPDVWDVSEDTSGGDRLPDDVARLLNLLGLGDDAPDVPQPELAADAYAEDEDGPYAVWWDAVGDDPRMIARYASAHAAQAVAAQYQRELRAQQPGDLLCGYGVRVLDGGRWVIAE